MRKIILFSFIFIFAIISRFLFIGRIPPVIDTSVILSRHISAFLSVGSILLWFVLLRYNFRKIKLVLLSAWTMAVLPWAIEQGRIVSQANNALFFCLLIFLLIQRTNRHFFKILLWLFIPLGLYFIYPQFWVFRFKGNIPSIFEIANNLFILLSPDFLFFKNITFWWGGIKEFGVMYASFLPVFSLGLYELIVQKKYEFILLFIFMILISAASPFFPESREFFLSVPLISLVVGKGLYRLSLIENRWIKFTLFFLIVVMTYEMAQYFHYYTVHYGQEVIKNKAQIYEAF